MNSATNEILKSRPSTPSICDITVLKRDRATVNFELERIQSALEKAFRAEQKSDREQDLDAFTHKEIIEISNTVAEQIVATRRKRNEVTVEEIQDLVEVTLMQFGYYGVAKRYILYRNERAQLRAVK